jgi:L-asparaginase/Glu-tRNA(Gln) amidotransferase subunit D
VNAAVRYSLSKNVPVVLTTSVYYGGVQSIYGDPGGGDLLKEGAILGANLTSSKVRLLLIIALLKYGSDAKRIKATFSKLRGAPR